MNACVPKSIKKKNAHKNLDMQVHGSTILNNQKVEASQVSMDGWLGASKDDGWMDDGWVGGWMGG